MIALVGFFALYCFARWIRRDIGCLPFVAMLVLVAVFA